MLERTRKKTNTSEISEEEWNVVRDTLAYMKASWMHVKAPGTPRSDTQEMMEEYAGKCEKAIKTGKKTDLPKMLQTKLEQHQRVQENQALAKTGSPPKAAATEPTPSSTTYTTMIAKASEHKEKKRNASAQKEKKKGEKDTNKIKAKNKQKLWQFRQIKNRTVSW